MAYSGYRFALAAANAGKPIADVNIGKTRADDLLTIKVENNCSAALLGVVGEGSPKLEASNVK